MADWNLDDVVKNAKEKFNAERTEDEKAAKEAALKQKLGAEFERNLFLWLQKTAPEFNRKFGAEAISVLQPRNNVTQVKVAPSKEHDLTIEFVYDPQKYAITWTQRPTHTPGLGVPHTVLPLVLDGETQMRADWKAQGRKLNAEELGQAAIEKALDHTD